MLALAMATDQAPKLRTRLVWLIAMLLLHAAPIQVPWHRAVLVLQLQVQKKLRGTAGTYEIQHAVSTARGTNHILGHKAVVQSWLQILAWAVQC